MKDSAWWRRERIVELGEEFGAAGPAVIDWLSCEAKVQDDGGRVKSGLRSVARGCFVDVDVARHVLSRARSVTVGLIEDYVEDGTRFECRLSGWSADNARGGAALRQRASRERRASESGSGEPDVGTTATEQDVTGRDLSRSVTSSHLRGEESREEVESQSPSGLDSLRRRIELTGLSERMAARIREADPKARVAPDSLAWLDPLRLLVDRDGRSVEEVERVIDFCATDDFESKTVLSPSKLRKRFDELVRKASAAPPTANFERAPRVVPVGSCPSGAAHLTDLWLPIEARLRESLGDDEYALQLGSLHLHGVTEERAWVGCSPRMLAWLSSRFSRSLAAAAGVPVELVACEGIVEAAA